MCQLASHFSSAVTSFVVVLHLQSIPCSIGEPLLSRAGFDLRRVVAMSHLLQGFEDGLHCILLMT